MYLQKSNSSIGSEKHGEVITFRGFNTNYVLTEARGGQRAPLSSRAVRCQGWRQLLLVLTSAALAECPCRPYGGHSRSQFTVHCWEL